jgi:hypothetical protein
MKATNFQSTDGQANLAVAIKAEGYLPPFLDKFTTHSRRRIGAPARLFAAVSKIWITGKFYSLSFSYAAFYWLHKNSFTRILFNFSGAKSKFKLA